MAHDDLFYLKAFENHRLDLLAWNEKEGLYIYNLHEPGTCIMATLITFSRYGIQLFGDTCFGSHDAGMGISGARCKSREWFASDLGTSYLLEKFMRKWKWTKEGALEVISDHCRSALDGGEEVTYMKLGKLVREMDEQGELTPDALHEIIDDCGLCDEFDGSVPGYDYPEHDAGWLIAVQKKFSQLFTKEEKVTPLVGG